MQVSLSLFNIYPLSHTNKDRLELYNIAPVGMSLRQFVPLIILY